LEASQVQHHGREQGKPIYDILTTCFPLFSLLVLLEGKRTSQAIQSH